MTQTSLGNYEASWGQYGADEWSDAMIASMKLGGVDNLFFVSGSDHSPAWTRLCPRAPPPVCG